MTTPPTLLSARLGPLSLDFPDDDPGEPALGFKAAWSLPAEGEFVVSLPDAYAAPSRSAEEWQEFVAALDRNFESLMARIPQVRADISEGVLLRVKEASFEPEEPLETTADLEKRMKLTQVIYFPTGEVRLYYQIDTRDPVFGRVDYGVDLNADGEIADAYFDG